MSQSHAENTNEKINAIKSLLNRNSNEVSINDQLKLLLSDKGVNQINEDVALLWESQANISQKLQQLAALATNEQKKIMSEILSLSNTLKKIAAKATSSIEEERKNLIVIQEVFRTKVNEKAFNKSFKDKSFQLTLEEMLNEKSQVLPKKNRKKVLEEEDDKDTTKFFSMAELKDEIESVRQSFVAAKVQDSKETEDTLSENIIPQKAFKKQSKVHPFTKKLIESNEAFKLFPVKDSKQNREQLPVLRDPRVKLDIWGILKNNIGKDLSQMTLPVHFNEPLSLLQKQAESMEYFEFLKKANHCDNQYLRLMYVFAFLYMGGTNIPNRMKKPFDSVIGETFEIVIDDIRYISEQVSEDPPIIAYHCESNDFIYFGDFYMKNKLSIAGFEFIILGNLEITLKKTNETFKVTKDAHFSLHNYIIGNPYLWINGEFELVNTKTNDKVNVMYKPKGWTSKNDFEVSGNLKNAGNETKYQLFGKWDSFLSATDSETKNEIRIASKIESPKDCELQYYFSKFSINLNHLSKEMIGCVAPTDTRFRPDQRAYENGNMELASQEMNKIEVNQRNILKQYKDKNMKWKPVWFDFVINGEEFNSKYKGGYFECRESGVWPSEILDLFNN